MANDGDLRHLTSEQMQEFLDRGLSSKEETEVQEHLSVCPHCRDEVETWNGLYAQLGSLPTLEPDPAFSRAIMERFPARRPLAARVLGWLGERAGARGRMHLPPERIQDYLEGLLPPRASARAAAHLATCEGCASELEGWRRLFGSMGTLDRTAPSAGFAQRVMAGVRVPVPAPTPWTRKLPGLVWEWTRKLLPQSRRGWAIAGGIASAPTITAAALLYQVFSHPLLSLGSFSAYAYWKVSALLGAVSTALADRLVESVALFRAYTLVESVMASPVLAGLGGLAFSLLSAAALWVLYRNPLTASPPEGEHAPARV